VIEGNSNSLMADALFPSASAAGAISVPELQRLPSPLDQELGKSQHAQHVTTLLQGPGSLLIAVMRRPVPPEQAVTWAQAVTAALSPKAVVAATSMLAKDYRGPGSPADEDMVFAVQTSAARPVNSVAPLPPGSVISGLAASLLEHCESAGLPATALVAVEHAPVPESGLVCRMAEAVSAVVGGVEAPGDSARRAIGNALNGAYQSSASNSMFS